MVEPEILPPAGRPSRILLAEDSEHDWRFFERELAKIDGACQLERCADGESALARLAAEKFDLLVVDLNLPGIDGIEIIRRAGERLDDTAVIVLTGSRDFGAAREALRLRVADFISKEPREELRAILLPRVQKALQQLALVRENARLESELRLHLAHLKQIQGQIPEALLATLDAEGNVIDLAGAARKRLGLPEKPAAGALGIGDALARISPAAAEAVRGLLADGRAASNLYIEEPGGDAEGSLYLLSLARVAGGGAAPAPEGAPWVMTLRDVTPEKAARGEAGPSFHGIVGRDPAILEMCELIRRVAPMPTTVLVTGPTGSGKELVARAIHAESPRARKPFIAVNCTALSREILESELFGHVRGAFTGAMTSRAGRFREADGGTLFLDEIGDTQESFQTKLLRALESGEIEPVGQDRPIKVDVRIVCATNQDLWSLVEKGRFRKDLYFRINVVRIRVPPLAERPGDLPLILEAFRNEMNGKFGKHIRAISSEAMRAIARHDWPGNVRELRHVMEHAYVVSRGPTITLGDLPEELAPRRPARRIEPQSSVQGESAAPELAGAHDKSGLQAILDECGGRMGEAADRLGVHRTTLWRRMRQLGIKLDAPE